MRFALTGNKTRGLLVEVRGSVLSAQVPFSPYQQGSTHGTGERESRRQPYPEWDSQQEERLFEGAQRNRLYVG
jgi:hypothetical protein